MKSSILIYFDKSGMPVDYKLACNKSKELEFEKTARRMMQAAIEGPHKCQCGGKCQNLALIP
jgi:hypothetical protein